MSSSIVWAGLSHRLSLSTLTVCLQKHDLTICTHMHRQLHIHTQNLCPTNAPSAKKAMRWQRKMLIVRDTKACGGPKWETVTGSLMNVKWQTPEVLSACLDENSAHTWVLTRICNGCHSPLEMKWNAKKRLLMADHWNACSISSL